MTFAQKKEKSLQTCFNVKWKIWSEFSSSFKELNILYDCPWFWTSLKHSVVWKIPEILWDHTNTHEYGLCLVQTAHRKSHPLELWPAPNSWGADSAQSISSPPKRPQKYQQRRLCIACSNTKFLGPLPAQSRFSRSDSSSQTLAHQPCKSSLL